MRRYIIACLVAISAAQFGSITIDWNQGVPEVNFAGYDDGGGTHLEHVELTNEAAPFDDMQTEFEEAEAEASPPSIEDTPPDEVYETEYLDGHQRIHEPPELLNKQDTATASRSYLARRLATSCSLADGRKVGSSRLMQSPTLLAGGS